MTDVSPRTKRRFLGLYCHQPEVVIAHAVQIAFSLSASLDRKVLFSIARDSAMLRQASALVVRYVVREATAGEELKREDFLLLVRSVAAILRSS